MNISLEGLNIPVRYDNAFQLLRAPYDFRVNQPMLIGLMRLQGLPDGIIGRHQIMVAGNPKPIYSRVTSTMNIFPPEIWSKYLGEDSDVSAVDYAGAERSINTELSVSLVQSIGLAVLSKEIFEKGVKESYAPSCFDEVFDGLIDQGLTVLETVLTRFTPKRLASIKRKIASGFAAAALKQNPELESLASLVLRR